MDLKQRIETVGGKYRLILHYRNLNEAGLQFIGRALPTDTTFYVGKEFGLNRDYWLSETDHHWNRSGHQRFARSLYELLRRDNLVPGLNLPLWSEAAKDYQSIIGAGRREVEGPLLTPNERLLALRSPSIASKIDFTQLTDVTAAQIHIGIDSERMVSPYASFVLSNQQHRSLRVSGRTFQRPEIFGAKVGVFVDDSKVGQMEITTSGSFDLKFAIPASLSENSHLSLRFVSDDYFYKEPNYQHCVVFQLDAIELQG
ncbi:MAG: hypothetical protein P8I38_07030 [Arenicella sp.]|nr:hypothetical protein [Arenicella sp.]